LDQKGLWEPYDYDAEDEEDHDEDAYEGYDGSEIDAEEENDSVSGRWKRQKVEGELSTLSWGKTTSPMMQFGMPFRGYSGFDEAFFRILD
jgi:hypothetical protein